ncbi:MAG: metallophosphoesterase, partial [Prevotellaceae bacterium]|nr:metallophosphoesterase [Candidatus Faecinaster equi]
VVASSEGQTTFHFVSNRQLTAKCDSSWCSVKVEGSNLRVSVKANTGLPRKAEVNLCGKDLNDAKVTICQLGKNSPIYVSPTSVEIDKDACDFGLTLATGVPIKSVTISEGANWLTPTFLESDLNKGGNINLSFNVTAMLNETERKATITITDIEGNTAFATVDQVFKDALSFAVISDNHVGSGKGVGYSVKVPQALRSITSYKPLDAIFVTGDLTDGGSISQYTQFVNIWGDDKNFINPVDKLFFMMGNHDNFSGDARSNYQLGLKDFNMGKPYPLDQYCVIKGYPFISLSQRNSSNNDVNNSANGTGAYPKEVCDSLRKWLVRATNECPDKPIFIFTHVAPRYTCYSSWPNIEGDGGSWAAWSMNVLNPILKDYPQAVVFAGHSHYPLGDPRSIHQGVNPNSPRMNYYTVINTGSTTYTEIHGPSVDEGNHPVAYEDITEGMIISECPNGNIEIRRYDTFRNEEIDASNRWILKAPFDGSMFEYADIRDADDNPDGRYLRTGKPAPTFNPEAVPSVKAGPYTATISIPQAIDNECVFRYRVRILNGEKLQSDHFVFSQFYLNSAQPDSIQFLVSGLKAETTYTAEVTAYDSYENVSESISAEFTTAIDNDPANVIPERIGRWVFNNSANLLENIQGKAQLNAATFTSTINIKATATDASIKQADGPTIDNKAVLVPASSLFILKPNVGKTINNYTLQLDVMPLSNSGYGALLQTSATNSDDADLFVTSKDQIGVGDLGYGGKVNFKGWNRIVFVNRNGHVYLFLNGNLINDATSSRWNISTDGALLFADENGEVVDMRVAEISFWDKALTDNQVYRLGEIEISNFINIETSKVLVQDDNRNFSIIVNSNVKPIFTLPSWVEVVDTAGVEGIKEYKFRAEVMKGLDTREGVITISGIDVTPITITVIQKLSSGGVPDPIGIWRFNNPNDMELDLDFVSLVPAKKDKDGQVVNCTSIEESGITRTNGVTEGDGAIHIPAGTYLKLMHMQPGEVRTYTILYDLKPDKIGGYQSLLQTNLKNTNDCDLCIKNNTIGLNASGLGYSGNLQAGKWHRIVFVVNDGYSTLYLDGKKISASTSSSTFWTFDTPYAFLFADDNGEEGSMNLSEFRYWNIALTAEQVADL